MINLPQGTNRTPTKLMDFKEFERAFNVARRSTNATRQAATGTLTPAAIERGIRTKQGANVSERGGDVFYSPEKLKIYRQMMTKIQKEFGGSKSSGAPVKKLIGMSTAADIKRSNAQIKNGNLYQVRGNLLKYSVRASGESGFDGSYQVRIRLDNWDEALVSGKTWPNAAKAAATGNVSFDCQCGRHQYWYRYLAGVGGFAVEPPQEKDFPKIRNPSLEGACCKHVLRVLNQLGTPTTVNVLAGEMERQANAAGFGKVDSRFLNADEQKNLKRGRNTKINAAAAYKDYLKSIKGMKAKAKTMNSEQMEIKKLKAKDRMQVAQIKRANQEREKLQEQASLSALTAALYKARSDAVMKAALAGKDPMAASRLAGDSFVGDYAKTTGSTEDSIRKTIKEYSL